MRSCRLQPDFHSGILPTAYPFVDGNQTFAQPEYLPSDLLRRIRRFIMVPSELSNRQSLVGLLFSATMSLRCHAEDKARIFEGFPRFQRGTPHFLTCCSALITCITMHHRRLCQPSIRQHTTNTSCHPVHYHRTCQLDFDCLVAD